MLFRTADMSLASTLDEYKACFSKPQFRPFKTFMSGLKGCRSSPTRRQPGDPDRGRSGPGPGTADRLDADVFLPFEGDGQYRYCMERVTEIKGGMTVKFLFFKDQRDDKNALVLMTNALDMPVQDVLRYYKMRWDVEVFYRDCKQYLGMGEYQVRKIYVGVIHLLLVILAYTILKGIARTRSFQNIFKGADAVGSMCEALKWHVALKMFKLKAFG